MKTRMAAILAVLAWGLASAGGLEPKITELTVFKDGHALVLAKGEAELKDGWCTTREVPVPVLGTFWSFVEKKDAQVDFVKSGRVEAAETRPCLTFEEILKANVGKQVTITEQTKEGPPVVHSGKLRGILEHKADRESAVAHTTPVRYDRYTGRRTGGATVNESRTDNVTAMASFVMVETDTGVELIQRANIRGIALADKNPVTTHTETKLVREIALRVSAKGKPLNGKATVGMVYVQKGVRWIPSYRVELLDDGKARISLRGTIINDLADFENARLNLVVGVPSFIMKNTLSPMALRDAGLHLSSYFRPPARGGAGSQHQMFSNMIMSQVAMPAAQQPAAGAGGPNIPSEGQMEDLFLYPKDGISLKKGERAVVHLLDVTVPYEDVYVWEIPYVPPKEMWRHIGSSQRNQLAKNLAAAKAMHKLRLTNTGDKPWTTGPATVFRGFTPLGQQLMTFTSVKNKVDLPITVAVDVNTKKEEREVSRERNAIRIDGTQYSKITVKGTLTVTNFKTKPVAMSVKRQIVGAVTETADDAKVRRSNSAEGATLSFEGYYWWGWGWPWWWMRLNPISEINWDMTVPAGKAKTFEYTYYYYPYQ